MTGDRLPIRKQRRQKVLWHRVLAASSEHPMPSGATSDVARLRVRPRPTPLRQTGWRRQGLAAGYRSRRPIRWSLLGVVSPSAGRGARSMLRNQKSTLAQLPVASTLSSPPLASHQTSSRQRRLASRTCVGVGGNLQRLIGRLRTIYQRSTNRSTCLHFRCSHVGVSYGALDNGSGNRNNRRVGRLTLRNRDRCVGRLLKRCIANGGIGHLRRDSERCGCLGRRGRWCR